MLCDIIWYITCSKVQVNGCSTRIHSVVGLENIILYSNIVISTNYISFCTDLIYIRAVAIVCQLNNFLINWSMSERQGEGSVIGIRWTHCLFCHFSHRCLFQWGRFLFDKTFTPNIPQHSAKVLKTLGVQRERQNDVNVRTQPTQQNLKPTKDLSPF